MMGISTNCSRKKKISKKKLSKNELHEMKLKLEDEAYVQGAIQRLALILSDQLLEMKDLENE